MKENIIVGAYWASRKESRIECASRVSGFLASIADADVFSFWYRKERRKSSSRSQLRVEIESILPELKSNNRDDNGMAIEELGFSFGAWNGRDVMSASLSVRCGAFSNVVGNAVVLSLPDSEAPPAEADRVLFRSTMEKMLVAFDPDTIVLTSTEFLNRLGGGTPVDVGGWVVYRRGEGFSESY